MDNIKKENIRKLAKHNGDTKVFLKLSEECGELIQASQKYQVALTDYTDNRIFTLNTAEENLISEMADVEIMLEQTKNFISRIEVEREKEFKVKRQLERFGIE